jgi:hypothetical protein
LKLHWKKKKIFPEFSKLEKNWTQRALIFFSDFKFFWEYGGFSPILQKKKTQLSYICKFFTKTYCKIEKHSPQKKTVEAILPKACPILV